MLVLACACAEAAASCAGDWSPPCQAFWKADVVFVGTAVEVTHSEKYEVKLGDDPWDGRDNFTRFQVEEVFRGEAARELTITGSQILDTPTKLPDGSTGTKNISTGDCEYHFEPGERYFVYANFQERRGQRTLRVGLNRTSLAAKSAEDFAYARGLKSAAPPNLSAGRVYGRVLRHDRDLKSNASRPPAPVAGVRVEVSNEGGGGLRVATTDREGFYEVAGLAPGAYVARAQLPETLTGYRELKARLVARGCAQMDFYTHYDGRVAGRVIDSQGRPVAKLKVELISAEGPPVSLNNLRARTDRDGRYELTGVPPGRHLVGFGLGSEPDAPYPRTYYPGVADSAQATVVEVGPGQRLELLDLRLPPPRPDGSVTVSVVWPDGRPVEGATLRLENEDYPWSSNPTPQERLEAAGRYRVKGFEGLTYWLHAYVNLKGRQMHAEPVEFVLGAGAGPLRLVIASEGGNCPHYRGARGRRQ